GRKASTTARCPTHIHEGRREESVANERSQPERPRRGGGAVSQRNRRSPDAPRARPRRARRRLARAQQTAVSPARSQVQQDLLARDARAVALRLQGWWPRRPEADAALRSRALSGAHGRAETALAR